jgi:hypothetical protein
MANSRVVLSWFPIRFLSLLPFSVSQYVWVYFTLKVHHNNANSYKGNRGNAVTIDAGVLVGLLRHPFFTNSICDAAEYWIHASF